MAVTRIQLRRGTAAQWTAANPIMLVGERGVEIDTGKEKSGDGVTAWNSLPYMTTPDGSVTEAKLAAGTPIPQAKVAGLVTDLAGKVATSDPALTNQRVPTDGSVTNAKVAAGAGIAPSKVARQPADVAELATGGTGTSASPWTGWQVPMEALPASSRINFSPGFYSYSRYVLYKTGWRVTGKGATLVRAAGTTGDPAIVWINSNVHDVVVEDLTIDLNKANTANLNSETLQLGVYVSASAGTGCTGIVLRRVKVVNGWAHGGRATAATAAIPLDVTLDDCDFSDNNYHGFMASLYDDLQVRNSRFLRNGTAAKRGSGLVYDGGIKATISGNTASDNYIHGITSSNRVTVHTTISDNTVDRNGVTGGLFGWGIVVSYDSDDVTVSDNQGDGNYNGGLSIDPQTTPASTVALAVRGSATGNRFKNAVVSTGHGISLNWVKFFALGENTCTGNPSSGIAVIGRENSITGNILTGNGTGLSCSWPSTATEDQGLHEIDNNVYSGNTVLDVNIAPELVGVSRGQSTPMGLVAANFQSLAHRINTKGKFAGRSVFDTTTGRPVWANGSTAAAVWKFSDGTTAYTPV